MFRVNTNLSVHDDGEKFYRIVSILNLTSGIGCWILHWGDVPRSGSISLKIGNTAAVNGPRACQKQMDAKSRSGYGAWSKKEIHLGDVKALLEWANAEMISGNIPDMLDTLGVDMRFTEPQQAPEPAKVLPVESETVQQSTYDEVNAWGSW